MKVVFDSADWVGHCSDGTIVVEGELFSEDEERLTIRCRFDGYTNSSDGVVRYLFYGRTTNK
jgi:hypothetical protein